MNEGDQVMWTFEIKDGVSLKTKRHQDNIVSSQISAIAWELSYLV